MITDRPPLSLVAPPDPVRPLRVLVVSASLGAGHDGAANELARRLRAVGHTVDVRDYLDALPGPPKLLVRDGYEAQIKLIPGSYDWLYKILETQRWALRVGQVIIGGARRQVSAWLEGDYDVVVSTYPLASQTLGRLKREGRLDRPVLTFLTDPSIHSYWVCPDVDLQLSVFPQTAGDARHLCPSVPTVAVGPLVHERHRDRLTPAERGALRREIGVTTDGPVALLVAGSWGVGDVERTVDAVLAGGVAQPLVACGHNAALAAKLSARPGVVALGWRTDMHRVMAAADVLIQNAGGLTCLEALVSDLPVVSHSCIPGHGYTNAQALEDAGLVPWSRTDADLTDALRRALDGAGRRRVHPALDLLLRGDAAQVVAAVGRTGDVATGLAAVPEAWAPAAKRADPQLQARAEHRLRVTVGPRATPGLLLPGDDLAVPAHPAADSPAPPVNELAARRAHRRTLRRAGAGVVAATIAGSVLGTSGVAAATSHGYGWTDRKAAAVVVRVDAASAGPLTLAELRADNAAVAVGRQLVTAAPATVRAITASHIDVLNGGWGSGRHSFNETQRDVISTRRLIAHADGVAPTAWVADRNIDAVDLSVAFTLRERVLVPAAVIRPGSAILAPKRGGVVVVDTRGLSDAASAGRIHDVTAALRAAGLQVDGVPDRWLHPPR